MAYTTKINVFLCSYALHLKYCQLLFFSIRDDRNIVVIFHNRKDSLQIFSSIYKFWNSRQWWSCDHHLRPALLPYHKQWGSLQEVASYSSQSLPLLFFWEAPNRASISPNCIRANHPQSHLCLQSHHSTHPFTLATAYQSIIF